MDMDVERLLGAVERTVSSLERDGQAARALRLRIPRWCRTTGTSSVPVPSA